MVVGLAPPSWGGPLAVFRAKREPGYRRETNEAMEFGNAFEEAIAQLAAKRLERKFGPAGTMRHPNLSILLATPDRLTVDEGPREGLECKFVPFADRMSWGPEGGDFVPAHVLIQVQQQMEVVGLDSWHVAAYFGGTDLRLYLVRKDPQLVTMLTEAIVRFWERHVIPGIPPPLDGSAECASWLAEKYPNPTDKLLPTTPESMVLLSEYREAKGAHTRATERLELVKNHLKSLIGEASGIEGVCSWRKTKDTEKTDWEGMARGLLNDLHQATGAETNILESQYLRQFTTRKPGHRTFRVQGSSNGSDE